MSPKVKGHGSKIRKTLGNNDTMGELVETATADQKEHKGSFHNCQKLSHICHKTNTTSYKQADMVVTVW